MANVIFLYPCIISGIIKSGPQVQTKVFFSPYLSVTEQSLQLMVQTDSQLGGGGGGKGGAVQTAFGYLEMRWHSSVFISDMIYH